MRKFVRLMTNYQPTTVDKLYNSHVYLYTVKQIINGKQKLSTGRLKLERAGDSFIYIYSQKVTFQDLMSKSSRFYETA